MLLVGGLDAWKREFGDAGLDRGVSSGGSSIPALNGGISSSSSSSSIRFTSPPYVRNRSGTESSLSSSFTSRELGTLNENSRSPPSTEPSPGPSYTSPQPSEGFNVVNGKNPFNRSVMANGRPSSSNRTELVCTSLSLYELKAEGLLGHTKLCERNHFHSIPFIPQTHPHVHFPSLSSSPFHPCNP